MTDFNSLLKKKGTGPTMSKSLWGDDFITLETGFKSESVHLTTKATLLTALLTLEPNPEEKVWLDALRQSPESFLPKELCPFITHQHSPHPLFTFILKAIQHQDLTREESITAIGYVLEPSVPEYLKAAFLEAERLKRESFEENKAFLDTFWNASQRIESDLPMIVDIANAYDGFNRNIFLGPFIAKALASLGIPTVLHGIDAVAPKYGINTYALLSELNIPLPSTLEDAHTQLKTEGWTYIDQSVSFPELHALKQLRTHMVKRPVLATIEKFLHPIHSKTRHILVTGYTHPAYKDMTTHLLMDAKKAHEFIFFRGTEGSSQLSLDRRAPFVKCVQGTLTDGFVSPEDIGISEYPKIEPAPNLTAQETLNKIKHSFESRQGLPYDTFIYNLSIIACNAQESSGSTLRSSIPSLTTEALSLFDNSSFI